MQKNITTQNRLKLFRFVIPGMIFLFISSCVFGQISAPRSNDLIIKREVNVSCAENVSTGINTLNDKVDDYFNLGGTVFADIYPLDFVLASLYTYDGSHVISLEHSVFDTLGYYYFMNLNPGPYLVKAEPALQSFHFKEYVPTYPGSVIFWQYSNYIDLYQDAFQYNVNLVPALGCAPGPGNITGSVVITRAANGEKIPAPDIEILLLNTSWEPLTYQNSDYWGNYHFSNLAFGTYIVYPELAGKISSPIEITLDATHPYLSLGISISEYCIIANNGPEIEAPENVFSDIYPVPSNKLVNIDYQTDHNQSCALSILDLEGNVIRNSEVLYLSGHNKISLDVESFAAGTYFVKFENANGLFTMRKFIKTH